MEENKTGTNKLAERILADARADAETTLTEAKAAAMALSAENVARLNALRKDFAQKRETAVQGVLDGSRTRAALDGRKVALQKKRAVLDAVFDRAYTAMCGLDASARGEICKKLLQSEAEGGETVVPSAKDRVQIEKIVKDLNVELQLSRDDAPFDGGFLLKGTGYEKDCSFRSLMEEMRGSEETSVAGLLFN